MNISRSSFPSNEKGTSWQAPVLRKQRDLHVQKINEIIYLVESFANTFMVTTPQGNIIIDTSQAQIAPRIKRLLQKINSGPTKYIILTHAHFDHRGGVRIWKEPSTEVIAQENHVEFIAYMSRLSSCFSIRSGSQYGFNPSDAKKIKSEFSSHNTDATILFKDHYQFELGNQFFEVHHTPGETYDALSVWMPEHRAAFIGDLYYHSFPNIYTLRGTRPRWALDYVNSLIKILSLEPEILLPGHGSPLFGYEKILTEVGCYIEAILYIHEKTVEGMNQGKDVFTLMREIKLPPELQLGEAYGKVSWSIRGIYEGYIGWFDGNPANMYNTPPAQVYPELVALAGGARVVAHRALTLINEGQVVEGLHLADMALSTEPDETLALKARYVGLRLLMEQANNSNEISWLHRGIMDTLKQYRSVAGRPPPSENLS